MDTEMSIFSLLSQPEVVGFADFIESKRGELGISKRTLCSWAGMQRLSYDRILNGEAKTIDILTFLKLAQFFNINVDHLIHIYVAGVESNDIKELDKAKKAGFILKYFDLDQLKKTGFIDDKFDFENIENRIRNFFGLNSIFEYGKPLSLTLFSKTANQSSDKMLNFWLSVVQYQLGRLKNKNPYNRDYLLKIIPKIRSLTLDEENGLAIVIRELYKAGVTVLIESYLGKTQIRGGTFLHKENPCIVLTTFNKRYDTLWFSLVHELYHVLKDMDLIRTYGYHLTGEENLFTSQISEQKANKFANELLLPENMLESIAEFIDIQGIVEYKSKEWQVHEKIIYGRYMSLYPNDHYKYSKKVKLEDITLTKYFVDPWKEDTLEETIKIIDKFYKELL
jgi:Zn-dependent peptidase ImmA (M78 family)/transcriptional regulator with XRE-family HTH domain